MLGIDMTWEFRKDVSVDIECSSVINWMIQLDCGSSTVILWENRRYPANMSSDSNWRDDFTHV